MSMRAAFRIYASYDSDLALPEPLWHSRQLHEHFSRNAATAASLVSVSSLDENTVRCKERTVARSYMNSKPVNFRIRFYAVSGGSKFYLHIVQDNGSRNKSGQTPVQRYTNGFRNLCGAVERKIDGTSLPKRKPSALRCEQITH